MSAINPASFIAPLVGLQLPSGLGPGAFASDLDQYSDRRQQKCHAAFGSAVPVALSHMGTIGFDRMWDPNHEAAVASGMTFPQVYPQPFQPQELEPRRLEQYPLEFRQNEQQTVGLHSRFTASTYAVSGIHQSPYRIAQEIGNGEAKKSQALANDWTQIFQGLSLSS